MTNPTRTAEKLELKQVFRKDAPIVFDVPIIRHCNASQRTLYTGNRMASPRGEAAEQAQSIASIGIGC